MKDGVIMKLFRNRLAAIAMISGICIAFVMFYYIEESEYFRIRQEKNDVENKMQVIGLCYTDADASGELDCLMDYEPKDGYAFLRNMDVYINSSRSYISSAIIFCGKIPVELFPLAGGRYPTNEEYDANEPIALVGLRFRNDVEKKDGEEYIEIEGEMYRVVGYLEDTSVGVLLSTASVQPNLRERVKRQINISLQYAMIPLDDSGEQFYDGCMTAIAEAGFLSQNILEFSTPNGETSETFLNYSKTILVFCMLFLCFAMEFWIGERLREFAIRRTVGVPVGRIWFEAWLQILACFMIGGLIACPIIILLEFTQKMFLIEILGIMKNLASQTALFLIVSSIAFSLIPAVLLLKCRPMDLLKENKG